MFRIAYAKLVAGAMILALGTALAALPQAQGVILQKTLSLDLAETIAQRALDTCRMTGQHASFAVLDGNGQVKAFYRDDGAGIQTVTVARIKAYTALIMRQPSMDVAKAQADKPDARIAVLLNAVAEYRSRAACRSK
jgi:hypothetical protein